MHRLVSGVIALVLLLVMVPAIQSTADDDIHGRTDGISAFQLDGNESWSAGVASGASESEQVVAQYGVACGSSEMSQARARDCSGNAWCQNGEKLMYELGASATTGQVNQYDTYCSNGDQPDIAALAAEEFHRYKPTIAPPRVCPPSRVTLVNIDTVFLTDSNPIDVPVTILGNSVVLKVTGISYQWNYGDGSTDTTHTGGWVNPGNPKGDTAKDRLPSGPVSHKYQKSGKDLPVNVTITYNGVFSVNGGQFQPIDGTINATSQTQTIWIRSINTELIDPHNPASEPAPSPDPNYPKPNQHDIDTCT